MMAEQNDAMAQEVARSTAEAVLSSCKGEQPFWHAAPLPHLSSDVWRRARAADDWQPLGFWCTGCPIPDELLI